MRWLYGSASVLCLALLLWHLGTAVPAKGQTDSRLPAPSGMAANRVVRVVDGDTVVINRGGKLVTCRLIGCNAPESVKRGSPVEYFGPEASAYLKFWLEGKVVRVSQHAGRKTDRYGRTLVYLWADKGTVLVNVEMVSRGYARFDPNYPTAYRDAFKVAQEKAKVSQLGLWGFNHGSPR